MTPYFSLRILSFLGGISWFNPFSAYEESKRKLTNFNAGQKKEQKNQELNRIKHDLFHGQLTHEQRLSLITMLSAMEEPPTSSADSVEEQQNQLDNKKASIFHSLSNTLFQKDYKPHVNHSNIDSLIHTVNCWSNLNLNSNLVHERFKQTQNETHNFDFSSADLGNLTHNLSTFSPKTHSISGSSMSSNKNTQSQISHGTGNSTSASVSGTLANVTLADSVGSLHSGTGLSSNNNANNVNNVNNVMNLQAIYANPSLNNSTTSLNTINTTNSENSPSQTFLNNASQVSSSSINFNQAINNSNLMSQGLKNHSLQNSGPIIGSNMNHASQIITTQMSSSGGSTFDVGQILAGNLAVSHASSSSSSGNINGASSKNLQDALFKRPKME